MNTALMLQQFNLKIGVPMQHCSLKQTAETCFLPSQGSNFVAVRIGCPPGKRLAFDITGTLELVTRMNKRYFDCVKTDPEMPCFFFSDGKTRPGSQLQHFGMLRLGLW